MPHYIVFIYPTQTQYHHELKDTVIAQKGLIVARTQLQTIKLISTVATHNHMYKHSTVMGFECKFPSNAIWLLCKVYIFIPLPVFDNRMKAENIVHV